MVELRAGRLRCELQPALGGCIAGLWWQDAPVLRALPAAEPSSALAAACHPMVPFALHGVAWQRPWTVLDQDESSAMLAYEHRADDTWPHAFDCSHTLRLGDGALELALALTNHSAQPAPAGPGWQAFFPRRPGHRLVVRASGRAGEHGHEGWDGNAEVLDERMAVRVQSGLTRLLVLAEAAREEIALAPVSHLPATAQPASPAAAALGLALLQPGESLVAQMRIAVEPQR
jgi:aldose 1-epimerase